MKAKRFLAMLLSICLAVLTLFSFVGCGNEGTMVTLSKAYSLQWLTREDFMNISYYRHGSVWIYQNGKKQEIDFQPTVEKSEMNERLERQSKRSIYAHHREYQSHIDEVSDIIITGYFGVYNGNYVVEYRFQGIDEGEEAKPDIIIGDIPFLYRNSHFLRVIQFNK